MTVDERRVTTALQAYAQATLLAREGIITNFGLFDRTTSALELS